MKNNNAKNGSFNKGTKPVTKTLPISLNGSDHKGNPYNVASAEALLDDLQKAGVFSKLSVYVTMAKSICLGTEARGVMSVARIQSVDAQAHEMTITFYAKNTEYAKLVDDMMIMPRLRTGRDSDEVTTFFGFEIIPAHLKGSN